MSGQDWSIKISQPKGSALAVFTPDLLGMQPGDPLQAGNQDLISWNNTTRDSHWPWAIDATTGQPYQSSQDAKDAGFYLSDEIPAGESSTPAYATTAQTDPFTIDYICKIHPDETGSIVVTND